jgi:hypothetical protein
VQPATSHITFKYQGGQLKMDGQFGHDPKVKLRDIVVLQSGVTNVTVNAPFDSSADGVRGISNSATVSDVYVVSMIVGELNRELSVKSRNSALRDIARTEKRLGGTKSIQYSQIAASAERKCIT